MKSMEKWRPTLLRVLTAAYLRAALGELQNSCRTGEKHFDSQVVEPEVLG